MANTKIDYVGIYNDWLNGKQPDYLAEKYDTSVLQVKHTVKLAQLFELEWKKTAPSSGDRTGIEKFTARDLMMELKRRGYSGKLYLTKCIDLANFVPERGGED